MDPAGEVADYQRMIYGGFEVMTRGTRGQRRPARPRSLAELLQVRLGSLELPRGKPDVPDSPGRPSGSLHRRLGLRNRRSEVRILSARSGSPAIAGFRRFSQGLVQGKVPKRSRASRSQRRTFGALAQDRLGRPGMSNGGHGGAASVAGALVGADPKDERWPGCRYVARATSTRAGFSSRGIYRRTRSARTTAISPHSSATWAGTTVAAGRSRKLPRFVATHDPRLLACDSPEDCARRARDRPGRRARTAPRVNDAARGGADGGTGVRVNEVVSIKCHDIDLPSRRSSSSRLSLVRPSVRPSSTSNRLAARRSPARPGWPQAATQAVAAGTCAYVLRLYPESS
jgi:hypothetical protein